jgi:hypothetical protein
MGACANGKGSIFIDQRLAKSCVSRAGIIASMGVWDINAAT